MGRNRNVFIRIHQLAHGSHLPALRAGGLRRPESLPLPRRQNPRFPHRGKRSTHAAHGARHPNGRNADRQVLRNGAPRHSPQRTLHSALRNGRRALHPSPPHRHRPTGGRKAGQRIPAADVRNARRPLFQGRIFYEQLCHRARIRPRRTARHGTLQGGRQLRREPPRQQTGARQRLRLRVLPRREREEIYRRMRRSQFLRHQRRQVHHAEVFLNPALYHQ